MSVINTTYDANEVNQYSSIRKNEESAFVPTFDAAGNQTLVRTATGTWSVTYNAENRPVIFQKTTDSVTTRITCTYDYMGRRATKKVEEITTDAEGNETTTVISNHRFIYRGYLQIGCCDLTRSGHPCLWLITWDPTQPVATRPLAIQKDGTWYIYGWDLTKNICEIFGQNGYIRNTYAYTPFGAVTANGDITQPIQWSSEHYDSELALVYYNYRHYNPTDGRWINRDPIAEQGGWNLYVFFKNDYLGLRSFNPWTPGVMNDWVVINNKIHSQPVVPDKFSLRYISYVQGFDFATDFAVYLNPKRFIYLRKKSDFQPNMELEKKGTHKCIYSILIIAHGDCSNNGEYAVMTLGSDDLCEGPDEKEEEHIGISSLFNNIKFCPKCEIELRSCYLGLSKYLLKRLKKITNCDIKIYDRLVHALKS